MNAKNEEMDCIEAIDVMGIAAEDRLEPGLVAGFEEHLAECRSCATYYDQLRHTRQTLRSLPRDDRPSHPGRQALLDHFRKQFGGDAS